MRRKKPWPVKYVPPLILAVLCAAQVVRWLPSYAQLLEYWYGYILNYYVIGYQDGFVSRGLTGTVARFLCDPIDSKALYLVLVCLYAGLYLAAIFAVGRLADHTRASAQTFFWGGAVLLGPAVTNFIYDFGRPDLYLTLIAVASLILCGKKYGIWLVAPLGVLGLLVHEGFLVLFAPLVCSELLLRVKRDKWRAGCALILCAAAWLGCFGLIYRFGKTAVPDAMAYWQQLQSHIDIPTSHEMVVFEFAHTLPQLLKANYQELFQWKTAAKLIFMLGICLPVFWLYARTMRRKKPKQFALFLWLVYFLAPFSPLLMILVGVDYGRWLSLAAVCVMLRQAQIFWRADGPPAAAAGLSETAFLGLCAASAGLGLIVGPMGDILAHFTYLSRLCHLLITPFGL